MWKYIKFLLRDEGGWIEAAIMGGSMLVGAFMQSKTAGRAAGAQTQAANKAAEVQLEMYYQTRTDLAPWREAGQWALGQPSGPAPTRPPSRGDFEFNETDYLEMNPDVAASAMTARGHYERYGKAEGRMPSYEAQDAITGFVPAEPGAPPQEGTGLMGMIERGPGEYEESPYYNFLLEEGTRGLERGAAARGGQLSGAEGKALTEYGQNLASTDYGNWLNRYYQSLGPYQSLAGVGQTAATSTAQAGMQAAGGQANALLAGGQAQAAGIMGRYAPYGNLLNWGGNQLMNYYMMNQLNQPGGSPAGMGSGGFG